jgi:hypothetical protein
MIPFWWLFRRWLAGGEMAVVCVLRLLGSFGRTLKAHCAHFVSKEATEHVRNLELATTFPFRWLSSLDLDD